ncbi:MAG TPA: DUF4012 domain-containing protein [Acidimicrobiales bacterium]
MNHVDRASPLLDASSERSVPVGTPHRPRRPLQQGTLLVGCLAAAVGGALADVAPTGNRVADRLLAAGFAGLLAAAGSRAERWTWFLAAGVALAMAGDWIAVAAGAIALSLALASTRPVRPAPAVGLAIGGLSAVALLRGDDLWFHGASALVVALVATPVLLSGYRNAGRRTRRRVGYATGVALVTLVGVVASYGALLARSRGEVERGIELLEQAMAAARDGDDRRAEQRFGQAADAFGSVEQMLGGSWAEPAEMLPVLGHNARAIQAMSTTSGDLSRQGRDAAADADLDDVTIEGGRLDLDRVRALERPLVEVSASLEVAATRLDAVDTPWLVAPVADRIAGIQAEVADARPDARLAADAVRVVPAIFGGGEETRWFVAFVTPVEARGRVGFMGNFAELTAVDGDVEMTRFGRTSELHSGGAPLAERTLTGPADYLARWGRYSPTTTWQNITMSPDFPSVGRVMAELYPQSGGRPVEGVIAVDPTGLAALLEFTGPVTVPGVPEPLTADNAARFMLVDQYVTLPDPTERVDALEALAEITFDRLTSGDLPGPREVSDTLSPVVRGGHIQLYSSDPAQQELFTEIGADGALPPVDGDFLAVVNSNATGNKIDVFLSRDIDYHATWDPASGEVVAELEVTLVNDAPRSGLPDSIIGNALDDEEGLALPSGTNRTHLSVYSPLALEAATLDGERVEIAPEVERDRYAYSVFLDVPPEGGARTLALTLQGRVALDGGAYRLDIANQPLVNPDRVSLVIESATGGPVRASAPMVVDGAKALADLRATQHETTLRVGPDG